MAPKFMRFSPKNQGYRLDIIVRKAHSSRSFNLIWKKYSFESHEIFAKTKAIGLLLLQEKLTLQDLSI